MQRIVFHHFITLWLLFLPTQAGYAQTTMYNWHDHLSYNKINHLVFGNNTVYAASDHGIVRFALSDTEIETYSKTNKLSDTDISAITFDAVRNALVVGYQSGKFDIVMPKTEYNNSDIYRANIQSSKQINHIHIDNNLAYFSTNFGIIVFDLEKHEIKHTYKISHTGSETEVYKTIIFENNLFALTAEGIRQAPLNATNLQDYNSWNSIEIPTASQSFLGLVVFNNRLLVFDQSENRFYHTEASNWNSWHPLNLNLSEVKRMKTSGNQLIIVHNQTASVFNTNYQLVRTLTRYNESTNTSINDICLTNNTLLVADELLGIAIGSNWSDFKFVTPNSPAFNHVFKMQATPNSIWAVGGAYNLTWSNLWNFAELYRYHNNQWQTQVLWQQPHRDLVSLAVSPYNTSSVYAGSWGWGAVEFANSQYQQSFSLETLTPQMPPQPNSGYAASMAFDDDNNLWISNSRSNNPIVLKTNSGKFWSLYYPEISGNLLLGKILPTPWNDKWLILPTENALFVFNDMQTPDNTTDDNHKKITVIDEYGNSLTDKIYDIAFDKDNQLWVASDKGIATYYQPENIFSDNNFFAERIKILSQTDSIVEYLLSANQVNCIAIDGANRKWFGTERSGVFLMSENATTQLKHFTSQNSPLFSNKIIDIAIEPQTGEVFFATDKGLISYQTDAAEPRTEIEQVYVFPNPVQPEYTGPITIRGLGKKMIVKITDIRGNLVTELIAQGGQAVWNGQKLNGVPVNSGIYIFMCANADGSQTCSAKVLIIRK